MSSPIERIVVPTDFSHASEAAVDYAGELAIRLPATVHLVHVIDELLTPEIARAPAKLVAALHEWLYLDARAKLARAAEALEPLGVRTTSEVRVGLPMTEIVLAANKARADLIVMATHGPDASTEPPSRRVADYVIRHARCPVLTSASTPSRPVNAGAAESLIVAAAGS